MTQKTTAGDLFQRMPELRGLGERYAPIQKATLTGDPWEVYKALRWAAWFGGLSADDKVLVKQIMANRRPFANPIDSAPYMLLFNGIGPTLYGAAEQKKDGTFIATYCFALFWIPLFPVAQYLVKAQGEGHTFFGKVPFGPLVALWRGVVGLGVLAGIASAGWVSVNRASHRDLWVVNGLFDPLEVVVDGESMGKVAPDRQYFQSLGQGEHRVEVLRNGRLIDQTDVSVGWANDPIVFDPKGC